MYKIEDNKGNIHSIAFKDDETALKYMKTHYIEYIYSVLSCDPIVVYRPNGYILAYIKTSDGSQTVKKMSDWI